jgi:hypothetical protein
VKQNGESRHLQWSTITTCDAFWSGFRGAGGREGTLGFDGKSPLHWDLVQSFSRPQPAPVWHAGLSLEMTLNTRLADVHKLKALEAAGFGSAPEF